MIVIEQWGLITDPGTLEHGAPLDDFLCDTNRAQRRLVSMVLFNLPLLVIVAPETGTERNLSHFLS